MSGDSVSGRADQLRSAASAVPSGAVNQLHTALEQLRDQLAFIIGDDSAEVVGQAQQQADAAAALFRDLMALRKTMNVVADYHAGMAQPPSGGGSGGGASAGGSGGPPPVTAPDGSKYPAAAKWAIDQGMPPRVQRNTGQITVGYVKINDVPMKVRAIDDPYSDMVDNRLREIGVRRILDLRRHVEMKMAAMVLRSPEQHHEVVINHAPCGSEPGQSEGCHAMLEPFLPAGRSLTVHGTTADGQPFSRTYHGKGP